MWNYNATYAAVARQTRVVISAQCNIINQTVVFIFCNTVLFIMTRQLLRTQYTNTVMFYTQYRSV